MPADFGVISAHQRQIYLTVWRQSSSYVFPSRIGDLLIEDKYMYTVKQL